MMAQHEFSLLKIYLMVVSVIGILGATIGYGIIGSEIIDRLVITDNEYIQFEHQWELDQCKEPKASTAPVATTTPAAGQTTTTTTTNTIPRTEAEIKQCQDDKHAELLAKRSFDSKKSAISGGVWGTLFLLLFITHFPAFIRRYHSSGKIA